MEKATYDDERNVHIQIQSTQYRRGLGRRNLLRRGMVDWFSTLLGRPNHRRDGVNPSMMLIDGAFESLESLEEGIAFCDHIRKSPERLLVALHPKCDALLFGHLDFGQYCVHMASREHGLRDVHHLACAGLTGCALDRFVHDAILSSADLFRSQYIVALPHFAR